MNSLVAGAAETVQGMEAFKRGVKREDNPYRWTPNSRAGDAKRASWELGWDLACSTEML